MNKVLPWVRNNVLVVVFLLLMIAALATMPFVSMRMNEQVRKDVEDRAKKKSEIERLRISVTPPTGGESQSVYANQQLINDYRAVSEAMSGEAERMRADALMHNRKGRTILMDELFPAPPPGEAEVIGRRFHEDHLVPAYMALLESVNAGTPPDPKQVTEDVNRARDQYIINTLQKTVDQELSEDELKELTDKLTAERLSQYVAKAETLNFYADPSVLGVPGWDQANLPSLSQMYIWQWRYWVVEDILQALARANQDTPEGEGSLLTAPVKRVLSMDIYGFSGAPAPTTGRPGRNAPTLGRGTAAAPVGGRPGGGTPASPSAVGPTGPPDIDYRGEVPQDFSASFTGRSTNSVYDVITVQLSLVVDASKLTRIVDALSTQNFITITDLTMTTYETRPDMRTGYVYGTAPVSRVDLTLETIWFREWTAESMPAELRSALGIKTAATTSG